MAGFTALTEAMGDAEALEIAEAFFAGARELLADYEANEVKTIGDCLMLELADAANAVRLGVVLATEVGVKHGFPTVRVGMHTGSALRRDDDWFGATVNLAARVSGAAAGGQVLLTSATRDAAGPVGARGDRRAWPPRDFEMSPSQCSSFTLSRSVRTWTPRRSRSTRSVEWRSILTTPQGLCAMAGRIFYFCSMRCIQAFSAAPDRYSAVA